MRLFIKIYPHDPVVRGFCGPPGFGIILTEKLFNPLRSRRLFCRFNAPVGTDAGARVRPGNNIFVVLDLNLEKPLRYFYFFISLSWVIFIYSRNHILMVDKT